MPNRNHNDKARANFNARHNCDSKHDKSKVRILLYTEIKTRSILIFGVCVCVRLGVFAGWLLGVQGELASPKRRHNAFSCILTLLFFFPGLEKGPQELSVYQSASGVRVKGILLNHLECTQSRDASSIHLQGLRRVRCS